MGLFDSKVKKARAQMEAILYDSDFALYDLNFSVDGDKNYCTCLCDELSGMYERAFGGDYESNIMLSYSEGRGLYMEVYFSGARARQVGQARMEQLVRDAVWEINDGCLTEVEVHYSFTRFVPGSSAMTFELTSTDCRGDEQFSMCFRRMARAIRLVAEALS